MSEELDPQVTLEDDADPAAQQDPDGDGGTPTDPAKPEEPYLSVNERTVYKTKDDAVRGYNEAASRIAQLSGWEKRAKQYGLSTPEQLDAVANELLALRKEKAEAAAKIASAPKVDANDPKAKETAQVREYLKNLGYISKEDQDSALKELRDQIAELKQSGTQSEELRFQNQEAEARQDLAGYMSAAGIKDDANGTKAQVIGTLVKDWINGSEERIEKWSKGGVHAKALVKEGTETMITALGWKAAPATGLPKPTDPGYAAAKAKALAANKKLPAPGTGKGTPSTPPKQKGHINSALHEKAWKLFQEAEAS
jgi:hypothetical protein